jgi:hypothetical protein
MFPWTQVNLALLINVCSFGSDHWNRGELVNLAARRAVNHFPGGFRLRAHVGDTVHTYH